jgi:CubicO group peptidase (beta-lactamase class C family)
VSDLDAEQREHVAAMAAHHLCAGVFVVGRDHQRGAAEVLAQDIAKFAVFNWQQDFEYEVSLVERRAAVWGRDVPRRTAVYTGDQGCTILPRGHTDVVFRPVEVVTRLPDPARQPWPTGDLDAYGELSDEARLDLHRALDWAMAQTEQNTRALLVVHGGKVVGERYASGFTRNTPQISWSMGKSITAALIGVLVERGHVKLDDPAPVAEWQSPNDPRRAIRIMDLLRMSSGLDFANLGLGRPDSWRAVNEHFLIYFDAVNVFDHAVNQPLEIPPNARFRYRNSDPLTLGKIVREMVEGLGEGYLTFPQRALFDRIGARTFVLETDAYGNFIMTGYDFGSAWDWARFGLLHLWDGMWQGDRVLPEGWVDFVRTPAPGDPQQGYGGLFWLNRGGALRQVPDDAFWAAGFMGQRTMIVPSRDMVIVRLGPSPRGFNAYFNEAVGRILRAVAPERGSP